MTPKEKNEKMEQKREAIKALYALPDTRKDKLVEHLRESLMDDLIDTHDYTFRNCIKGTYVYIPFIDSDQPAERYNLANVFFTTAEALEFAYPEMEIAHAVAVRYRDDSEFEWEDNHGICYCSNCHKAAPLGYIKAEDEDEEEFEERTQNDAPEEILTAFCPFCGARMKK